MKTINKNSRGFTLIELLMVIAIIGILAGILIPAVGAVKKQVNIAASKSQISGYVTAIINFKGEYGYFPFLTTNEDAEINLSEGTKGVDFIKTLSGRNPSSNNAPIAFGGNRRQIGFISFGESDFKEGDSSTLELADRFDNTNIIIVIDGDGDGTLTVPKTSGTGTKDIKASVTAYVDEHPTDSGAPTYYLYD